MLYDTRELLQGERPVKWLPLLGPNSGQSLKQILSTPPVKCATRHINGSPKCPAAVASDITMPKRESRITLGASPSTGPCVEADLPPEPKALRAGQVLQGYEQQHRLDSRERIAARVHRALGHTLDVVLWSIIVHVLASLHVQSFGVCGLQDVLPEFLRGRFVEAALSYVACNSEGELLCRNNDCWCHCSPRFPECNCPFADIKVMEGNLEKSRDAWDGFNQEFMDSESLRGLRGSAY
ncbi:BMP/retinoic acid-inducible neural-specific protein 3 [Liparis tanakae]|uniref:BMP/retinoic acid-inducible neural-specific protein 3 n=1 Tax=Liparis tanakae TaxID=230148 RepID=A0A4Z2IH62_9TELE|nr:BMP/retinoic acid-inducible neural-specific protein 3 [Liparis tanakae]